MIPKRSEAINNVIKMEIGGNRPIWGKRKKVDNLNSSKKDIERIKK